MLLSVLESILLASSCALDAFAASFAYGTKGIRIPWLSNQIINLICSGILGFSLWAGASVRRFLPDWVTLTAAFAILFLIGLSKLSDSVIKALIRRYTKHNGKGVRKRVRFSMFSVRFILSIAADPEEADVNENKIISPAEAAALAVSLSLDGLAVGFGAAFGNASILTVVIASLIANMLAVFAGCRIGGKLARRLPFNMSWLSGVILMGLAVSKLL